MQCDDKMNIKRTPPAKVPFYPESRSPFVFAAKYGYDHPMIRAHTDFPAGAVQNCDISCTG